MTREEQSQLCMLLAKMRYDIMKDMSIHPTSKIYWKKCDELLSAINRIMSYSYIDGSK